MANVKRKWALSRSVEREFLYLITVGCKFSSSASKAWAGPFKKNRNQASRSEKKAYLILRQAFFKGIGFVP
jgi:hypothetical protein